MKNIENFDRIKCLTNSGFFYSFRKLVAGGETTVAPIAPAAGQPMPPQTDVRSGDIVPNVPLAPLPEQPIGIPLAPMPIPNVSNTNATVPETTSSVVPNQTITSPTSVPLAPFPDPASQAQKASATTFAIFNLSVYTIVSLIVATIF